MNKVHLHLFATVDQARVWFASVAVREHWRFDKQRWCVLDDNDDIHFGHAISVLKDVGRLRGMRPAVVEYVDDVSADVEAAVRAMHPRAEHRRSAT